MATADNCQGQTVVERPYGNAVYGNAGAAWRSSDIVPMGGATA